MEPHSSKSMSTASAGTERQHKDLPEGATPPCFLPQNFHEKTNKQTNILKNSCSGCRVKRSPVLTGQKVGGAHTAGRFWGSCLFPPGPAPRKSLVPSWSQFPQSRKLRLQITIKNWKEKVSFCWRHEGEGGNSKAAENGGWLPNWKNQLFYWTTVVTNIAASTPSSSSSIEQIVKRTNNLLNDNPQYGVII